MNTEIRNLYGKHYHNGYMVDVFGWDQTTDRIIYIIGNKIRMAKRYYVCPFGGNPYPGTLIEYYNIILPNGKRIRLSVRA